MKFRKYRMSLQKLIKLFREKQKKMLILKKLMSFMKRKKNS